MFMHFKAAKYSPKCHLELENEMSFYSYLVQFGKFDLIFLHLSFFYLQLSGISVSEKLFSGILVTLELSLSAFLTRQKVLNRDKSS